LPSSDTTCLVLFRSFPLSKRIADERFIRLIRKFLNAGYIEDWNFHNSYSGTPQGVRCRLPSSDTTCLVLFRSFPLSNFSVYSFMNLSNLSRYMFVKWFVEGDIKGFFDNINHEILIDILKERIADERFIRLIRKFLIDIVEKSLNITFYEPFHARKCLLNIRQGSVAALGKCVH